ncbi:hypothetical protein ACGFZA_08785 [Streptomyces sp. NPDC048211]|uniref:hypothetical protein n=1 Tax=Streptomyces sp. NPDC048211 TaxID=3365516 RepID=UPI000ACEC324
MIDVCGAQTRLVAETKPAPEALGPRMRRSPSERGEPRRALSDGEEPVGDRHPEKGVEYGTVSVLHALAEGE